MIESENQNGVVTLTMSHGKVNAMDLEFCQALIATLDEASKNDQCRGVVLTGSTRAFSAGIDLKRWLAEPTDYVAPFLEQLERMMEQVFVFPKPIVAAISGHAIAGGCMIAAACDYRLIGRETKIGIPEMRIGVPLPMTAIEIMRFVANPNAFQSVVSFGALFPGADAVNVGLANEVVSQDSMMKRAATIVEELANMPQPAFAITKKQTRAVAIRNAQQNKQDFHDEYLAIWQSDATRTSVDAYVKQRLK